jgi:7-alpha-hydroxysteroid dehydrogenase
VESLNHNLLPGLRLSQSVARRMIKQAEGSEGGNMGAIINISSIASIRVHPDLMAYSLAAAAIDQMTRSLAVSLAPHRIRVNSLAFGSVMSNSLKTSLKDNKAYRESIETRTPLGRIAPPGELNDAAQFLASEASGFMTGQVVTVDGGRSLLDPVSVPAH